MALRRMRLQVCCIAVFYGSIASAALNHPYTEDDHNIAPDSAHGRNSRSLQDAPFMAELPLYIITTSPSTLLLSGDQQQERIVLSQKQTLQVVFSRPVIPLGSDFADEVVRPFTLEPDVEGMFRWVTTYIARFDPKEDWKPDLQIKFKWNTSLASWDGLPLLGNVPNEVRRRSSNQQCTASMHLIQTF